MGSDGPLVVLATSTEEELAQWMAALCQAAVEEVREGGEKGWEGSLQFIPQIQFLSSFHSMMVNSHSIPW